MSLHFASKEKAFIRLLSCSSKNSCKMSRILESKSIKYALYGTAALVVSEIGYHYFRRWMKRCADIRAAQSDREIADVIWINELTTDCLVKKEKIPKSPKNQSTKPYVHDDKNCHNVFCYPRNIGKIVALIDNAKYSIDLSMYIFTSFELSKAFHRALKRGLDIRIISDKEMVYSSGSQITELTKSGIPVRYPNATNMLMHHKFCIVDGSVRSRAVAKAQKRSFDKPQGILFTGSLNWTHQGFNANWENMVITSNANLVAKFEEEFQRMWISFKTLEITPQPR